LPPVQVQQNAEVGMQTGRWMAGELKATDLAWDDDAAARRAVATRHAQQGGQGRPAVPAVMPQPIPHGMPIPGPGGTPLPGQPMPQSMSLIGAGIRYPGGMVGPDGRIIPTQMPYPARRNWVMIAALISAFAMVGVVIGAMVFTQLLWPKLKLESDPPGAMVIVDDVPAERNAPVTVKVEPEHPHIIEMRMEGYRPERREISEGVGRGRTYTLQVPLRKIIPELEIRPIEGTVFVNGQKVARGTHIALKDLPSSGPVKIRIEAEGYKAWEQEFERAATVPESIDIPLSEDPSAAKPAPLKPPQKKR
jgi:hypothetical protein